MILYTEAQLQHAYIEYIRPMYKQSVVVVPTIEEFREIYEEEMRTQYQDDKWIRDR
jgi:hypothetical protein|tara:strand:+ start:400 stop:567 length:168 start_codon:yes stop_codon:yes gene_type:complete